MSSFTCKSLSLTLLIGMIGLVANPADAQYREQPRQPGYQPPTQTMASTQANAPRSGYTTAPPPPAYAYIQTSPLEGYKGRAGGYLSGGAEVINSQGNFLIQKEQANLSREQVNQAKIETRRKNIDEWLYERDALPTLEDERERARMQAYQRSRNNPPLTEIWSGQALNDLLLPLQKTLGIPGPNIPLEPELLRHINVTSGQGHNGVGLLKDGGILHWPFALQDKTYEPERKKIEGLLRPSLQQSVSGTASASSLSEMTKSINALASKLKGNIAATDANDYIAAKRYLSELTDSIKLLKDPSAGKYVTGQFSAQGRNVSELVYNMTRQGQRFGPATKTDQEAYTVLHRAMATYDEVVHQFVARQGKAP